MRTLSKARQERRQLELIAALRNRSMVVTRTQAEADSLRKRISELRPDLTDVRVRSVDDLPPTGASIVFR